MDLHVRKCLKNWIITVESTDEQHQEIILSTIVKRAHQIFEERGCTHGFELDDWEGLRDQEGDERGHRHRADRVEAPCRAAVEHGSATRATREAPPAEARLLKQRIAVVAGNQAVLFHAGKSKTLSVRWTAALAFACAQLSTGEPQKPGDIVSKAPLRYRIGWLGPESTCPHALARPELFQRAAFPFQPEP